MLLTALAAAAAWPGPLFAAPSTAAPTSRPARQEAIRALPFAQLTDQAKQKLSAVVSAPSVYRRMPVNVIDCDPGFYVFLVRHPEVVVNIWDLMGITKVSAKRTGPFTFHASDGAGTVTNVELVYGTDNTHVFYADAAYDGPLTHRPVRAKCVLLLRSQYSRRGDKRILISSQMDVFVRFDSKGADIVAKTLHPLVGRMADRNFVESTGFVGRLSRAAETNGYGVRRMAGRLKKVDPAVRERFGSLAVELVEKANSPVSAKTASKASHTSAGAARPSSWNYRR